MNEVNYAGLHEGVVVEVGDGAREHQLRARIMRLGIERSAWARPKFGSLQSYSLRAGQLVWLEPVWPAKSMEELVWSGWGPVSPDGISEIPRIGQEPPRGPAPLNRGIEKATTADLASDLGAPAPIEIVDVPVARTTQFPHSAVEEPPASAVRIEHDHTPGKERIASRAGLSYLEQFASGLLAWGGTTRVGWFAESVREFIGGTLAQVVAGDAHHTYEHNAVVSVGHTLFARSASLAMRLGSLSITSEAPTATKDKDGADPLTVRGAELFARGTLRLLAVGEWMARGKRVVLTSLEKSVLSSAGDVLIEAQGSLPSASALVFKAAGITPGEGKITARGKTVRSVATNALGMEDTSAALTPNGLDITGLLPQLGGRTALVFSDAGWETFSAFVDACATALTPAQISQIATAASTLKASIAAKQVRLADKLRSD